MSPCELLFAAFGITCLALLGLIRSESKAE